MITSQLKLGDRVRVVLEGEVSEVYSGSWTLAKTNGFTHDAEHVVSIEKRSLTLSPSGSRVTW